MTDIPSLRNYGEPEWLKSGLVPPPAPEKTPLDEAVPDDEGARLPPSVVWWDWLRADDVPRVTEGYTPTEISERDWRAFRTRLIASGIYDRMLAEQDGCCWICGDIEIGRQLAVDHDWKTGAVRGLLCGTCNQGLGFFKDQPERLVRAAQYLRKAPQPIRYEQPVPAWWDYLQTPQGWAWAKERMLEIWAHTLEMAQQRKEADLIAAS